MFNLKRARKWWIVFFFCLQPRTQQITFLRNLHNTTILFISFYRMHFDKFCAICMHSTSDHWAAHAVNALATAVYVPWQLQIKWPAFVPDSTHSFSDRNSITHSFTVFFFFFSFWELIILPEIRLLAHWEIHIHLMNFQQNVEHYLRVCVQMASESHKTTTWHALSNCIKCL